MPRKRDRLWIDREPRRMKHGDEPGLEMRFHDEWWHLIFETPDGYDVVLSPTGGGLGTFPTLEDAQAYAEVNARERAMNTLKSTRHAIERASTVLGALSR